LATPHRAVGLPAARGPHRPAHHSGVIFGDQCLRNRPER